MAYFIRSRTNPNLVLKWGYTTQPGGLGDYNAVQWEEVEGLPPTGYQQFSERAQQSANAAPFGRLMFDWMSGMPRSKFQKTYKDYFAPTRGYMDRGYSGFKMLFNHLRGVPGEYATPLAKQKQIYGRLRSVFSPQGYDAFRTFRKNPFGQ